MRVPAIGTRIPYYPNIPIFNLSFILYVIPIQIE